jgi:hypothetical protein
MIQLDTWSTSGPRSSDVTSERVWRPLNIPPVRVIGMVDRGLLAAIGEVIVDAAVLEYWIAVLVAAIEGKDEDRARDLAASTGATLRALKHLVDERQDWSELNRLYRDAKAVLGDRHALAHSVAFADKDADTGPGYSIWNPRRDTEARITLEQVLDHARDIRIVVRRARSLFVSEFLNGAEPVGIDQVWV